MKNLKFIADGWLDAGLEHSAEASTFTRLKVLLDNTIITRNVSKRAGGVSESINVPLLPLANFLASSWWSLLYEPYRSGVGDEFRARHRLDVPFHGYAFPALALCSGGNETLLSAWASRPEDAYRIEFLAPPSEAPEMLERAQVEAMFMDIVETCLERVERASSEDVFAKWEQVRASMADPEEAAYCKSAGRLGLDPYDPDAPDLSQFAEGLDDGLFEDIADAAFIEELLEVTDWTKANQNRLAAAPTIHTDLFPKLPADVLDSPAWVTGVVAAHTLREHVRFQIDRPRAELDELFGEVLMVRSARFSDAPATINALLRNEGDVVRIATSGRSARDQRFKACASAYLGWASSEGVDRAATPAYTRRQQSARAFAAEMLAPQAFLRSEAPKHGYTSEQLEKIAGELVCPNETVAWQAVRAGVPLRGVELRPTHGPAII